MDKPHTCLYGRRCWCGAGKTQTLNRRVRVAGLGGKAGWPIHSDAAGVHPAQVGEAYQESVRLGVPTQFDTKGNPILTDSAHRKRYCRAIGLHDRNGGYGDP